jgi:hypothetical protein
MEHRVTPLHETNLSTLGHLADIQQHPGIVKLEAT